MLAHESISALTEKQKTQVLVKSRLAYKKTGKQSNKQNTNSKTNRNLYSLCWKQWKEFAKAFCCVSEKIEMIEMLVNHFMQHEKYGSFLLSSFGIVYDGWLQCVIYKCYFKVLLFAMILVNLEISEPIDE